MEGYKIRPSMRAILVDWMVEVHGRFKLLQETLYLTVATMDRFLQVKDDFTHVNSICQQSLLSHLFFRLTPLLCATNYSLSD